MNDLKERFTEIMVAVDLLPDVPAELEDGHHDIDSWQLPDSTKNLDNPKLFGAIMCQALRNSDDYRLKLAGVLTATAVKSIANTDEDTPPSEADMYALALSANLQWATGNFLGLASSLEIIGKLCCRFQVDVPSPATLVLRPNGNTKNFANLDPYRILSDDYDLEEMITTTMESGDKPDVG